MTTSKCNRKQIDEFLADDVLDEDNELINHLETCAVCRDYFERLAAAPEDWARFRQFLQPTAFDHASSMVCSAGFSATESVAQVTSVDAVVSLLAPTDNPDCLGRLGTYEVTGVVGIGGMGIVLKAVDTSLDRVVAIKVLAPYLAHSETARRRFAREAKAAAAVLHPNVIPIHGVSNDAPLPYLVMSYIRGGSLQRRLKREGPLPALEILRIGSQVAGGLAAAHEQGLIHRDIKPANILLEEGVERVTLTDFGLARAVDDASVTRVGTIAGTPQYMSPEQVRGEPLDPRSDLFSLGSVLYELACARPPFQADSSYGVMRQITDANVIPISQTNADIPAWLCQVIAKLMENDKAKRFDSAAEVRDLLETCLGHVQQPNSVELPDSLASSFPIQNSFQKLFSAHDKRHAFGGFLRMLVLTVISVSLLVWIASPQAPETPQVDGTMPTRGALIEALKLATEDTQYAESYSEEAFQAIKNDTSFEDVEKSLGKPIKTASATPHTLWLYGPDEYPKFASTGAYPTIERECNVIRFDKDGKFVRAYGQSAGSRSQAADGEDILVTSGEFPIEDPASKGATSAVPGPLKISSSLYQTLIESNATQDEIRKRFGKPKAEYSTRVAKWLIYSHSPSGGNYRKRMIGIDKQGRVCEKRSEYYWD